METQISRFAERRVGNGVGSRFSHFWATHNPRRSVQACQHSFPTIYNDFKYSSTAVFSCSVKISGNRWPAALLPRRAESKYSRRFGNLFASAPMASYSVNSSPTLCRSYPSCVRFQSSSRVIAMLESRFTDARAGLGIGFGGLPQPTTTKVLIHRVDRKARWLVFSWPYRTNGCLRERRTAAAVSDRIERFASKG